MLDLLKNHIPTIIGMDECNKFAVSIMLLENNSDYDVLFEVRSSKINRQPGDICLPGGMLEKNEAPEEAALREASEELQIPTSDMEIITPLDILIGTGTIVYTYAVKLNNYNGSYSKSEVAETFTVPLSFFLNTEPEIYYTTTQTIPDKDFPFDKIYGGKNYDWRKARTPIYFYIYKNRVIWGMTAKIMRSFSGIYKSVLENKN
ncbi:MAG: NUDIX hydrolase [Christensenellaceae bacterium]